MTRFKTFYSGPADVEIELNKWKAEMSKPITILSFTAISHSGNIMTIIYYQI